MTTKETMTGNPMPSVVRIRIPAAVAADLGTFHKSMSLVAERLGCRTCFSGADCMFHIEHDWVINEKGELGPTARVAGGDPIPARPVVVTLAHAVSYDLKRVQESVAKIAGKLGCAPCCSGFDIIFRQELEYMVDEQLNIRG